MGKGLEDESWPISLLGVFKCQKCSLESLHLRLNLICSESPGKKNKLEVFIHYFYVKFTMES